MMEIQKNPDSTEFISDWKKSYHENKEVTRNMLAVVSNHLQMLLCNELVSS